MKASIWYAGSRGSVAAWAVLASALPLLLAGWLFWTAGNLQGLWHLAQRAPLSVLPALLTAVVCHEAIAGRGQRVRWPAMLALALVLLMLSGAAYAWVYRQLFDFAHSREWTRVEALAVHDLLGAITVPVSAAVSIGIAILGSAWRTSASAAARPHTPLSPALITGVGFWAGTWWAMHVVQALLGRRPVYEKEWAGAAGAFALVALSAWVGAAAATLSHGNRWRQVAVVQRPRMAWAAASAATACFLTLLTVAWRLRGDPSIQLLAVFVVMPALAALIYVSGLSAGRQMVLAWKDPR